MQSLGTTALNPFRLAVKSSSLDHYLVLIFHLVLATKQPEMKLYLSSVPAALCFTARESLSHRGSTGKSVLIVDSALNIISYSFFVCFYLLAMTKTTYRFGQTKH